MIRVREASGIGVISLARPEVRNALTPEMLEALRDEVRALGSRAGCVLIEGEGPVFCAGFDLSRCRESGDGSVMRALLRGLDGAVRAMRNCPAPVVVACRGAAIAGGCALAAGADFVVAERSAKLGYPVVLLGVSPAVSGPTLVPRIGAGAARARMLDPGLVSGAEAARIGLVTDLVDEADAVPGRAQDLACSLAAKGPGTMAATKAWLGELDRTGGEGSDAGLGVSLGLAGGAEERALLERFWGRG